MAAGDLDESVRRADPDRWLACRFIADPGKRAAAIAILAFDEELARAPRVTSSPLAAQIRLTWWRDTLDEILAGATPRAHPVALALADAAASGADLAPLHADIQVRISALDEPPLDRASAVAFADGAAGSVAVTIGLLLDGGADGEALAAGGRAIGLDRLRRTYPEAAALPPLVDEALAAARALAMRLSPACVPAVLAATLARAPLRVGPWTGVGRRIRLLAAALSGRL